MLKMHLTDLLSRPLRSTGLFPFLCSFLHPVKANTIVIIKAMPVFYLFLAEIFVVKANTLLTYRGCCLDVAVAEKVLNPLNIPPNISVKTLLLGDVKRFFSV